MLHSQSNRTYPSPASSSSNDLLISGSARRFVTKFAKGFFPSTTSWIKSGRVQTDDGPQLTQRRRLIGTTPSPSPSARQVPPSPTTRPQNSRYRHPTQTFLRNKGATGRTRHYRIQESLASITEHKKTPESSSASY